MELFSLGIAELRKMLEKREISARDIHDSVFKRIDAVEGRDQGICNSNTRKSP